MRRTIKGYDGRNDGGWSKDELSDVDVDDDVAVGDIYSYVQNGDVIGRR